MKVERLTRIMIKVVKIGGNVIDDAAALERFLTKFAALEGPKMLIHGGGKLATRLSAQLGIETQMIDGRRVTDRATLDVVTMVYAGLVNKQIVARLGALGCKAIGLSGADANVIPAVRRNMIVTDDVIEAPTSLVIPEAANREISATVVLKRLLEGLSD